MQKITPHLWFDNQAEEAASFYASVFRNSKILKTTYYERSGAEVSGRPEGSVMTVAFQIEGQDFVALNGGPIFKFNEAISFMVSCESQDEVDELWSKLSAHPESEQCGWLKDKFGVSWQIIPKGLDDMLSNPDPEKLQRVMKALLQMKKLNIEELRAAQDQG